MKVLIVGAGAVGRVLGLHLRRAGVELGFFARPASAESLEDARGRGGLWLYQVSHRRRHHPAPQRLADYRVVTDFASAKRFAPDQVWFTTPSQVYYSPWFREFLQGVSAKRVLCFAPEGARPEFITAEAEDERPVFGGITFIAWQGDLGTGRGAADVSYWLPPLARIPLVGSAGACREVGQLLERSGLRVAVRRAGSGESQAALTAAVAAIVAGLELAGWSFAGFRGSPWLKGAVRGSREAARTQLGGSGFPVQQLVDGLLSTSSLRLAIRLLPLATPFDLQEYLRFHYLKTREQTLTLLDVFEGDGRRRGLPVEAIRALRLALLDPRG